MAMSRFLKRVEEWIVKYLRDPRFSINQESVMNKVLYLSSHTGCEIVRNGQND